MTSDPAMDLLMWARGPGFQIATVVLLFGIVLRIVEILALGRARDLAPPKASPAQSGLRTVFSRFLPRHGMAMRSPVIHIGGYLFHAGFFIVLLFFGPHIQLFEEGFGIGWPGLPSPLIEAVTVISMVALVAVLIARVRDPVRKLLSTFEDYAVWVVTFLPFLTGFMAVNKLGLPYTWMMALHVLSVELLMVVLPFTKLTHAVTFLFARYYNGWVNGRKGAAT